MNRLKYEVDNVIIVGDIHGKFRPLNWEIHKRRRITNSLLIQAGDFGAGFHEGGYYITEFLKLNDSLKEANNTLLVVRGNHDDPEYFNGDWNYSNLKLVPDYTYVETNHGNLVCIGGAESIDKNYRTLDVTWWEGELAVYDIDKLKELEDVNINYIVAHSNPNFCYPFKKSPMMTDDIVEYAAASRKIITNIYDYLSNFHTILRYYNGHYHWSLKEPIKGTEFVTLGIMEFEQLKQ